MKQYGYLYDKIYDLENIERAHKNAKKGKLHYKEVKMVDLNPQYYFQQIYEMLKNKTFCNSKYKIFTKSDRGKTREIYKLPYFPDRIIHHCIMQVLEPIWIKTLISDTYSSLKGRGIHKGVKRIKKALKNKDNTKYCLKLDVKKFYPSINHEILKKIIRRKIKDSDVLWLLDEIIDSTDGVPIGNYLSQYFGNLYLSDFDHWMKEINHCKYYFRYCDDIVVLDSNKKRLGELRKEIENYFCNNLSLKLKGNWQVFPVDARGIDFLGYRFFHNYTLLRKSIVGRFKKRIRNIKKNWQSLKPINILSGVMSYWGWFKHADCFNLAKTHINKNIYNIINQVSKENKINNPLKNMEILL